mgnify:CR=1 FL=1
MIDMNNYYNPFNEKTILDNGEYSQGTYVDRKPICGVYLEVRKGTLLFDLEIKAKAKFKLEKDPENYCQEVRFHYFKMLDKYIDKFGEPVNKQDELHMKNYIAKGCLNELKNLAKKMKSNTSYYDDEKGEFIIQKLVSIGSKDRSGEISLDTLEYDIHNRHETNVNCYSDFGVWFNNYKTSILTKKQLDYLDDPSIVDYSNKSKIEKNIRKRIDLAYHDLTVKDCRNYELLRKIKLLERLLSYNTNIDMVKGIVNVMDDEPWLLEELYSSDIDVCRMITDFVNCFFYDDKVISRKISGILIKKIKEFENIVQK